ncbi:response regulator [Virgibacillus sp. DJP39]|uniref:response regulator n=1 Tax=Virgibacillus sp. DJP39 TaxID=3409790 RepID=UPI003BB4E762
MIEVILVEGQRLLREGIKGLIDQEEDMSVIGMADTGEESLRLIEEKQPDIVLMDIHMRNIDGIKGTIYLKEKFPAIKVIFITSFSDEDLIVSGLNAGADGFLFKDLNAKKLIQLIRDAYNGEMVLSGEVARILARKIRDSQFSQKQVLGRKLDNRCIYLSERELDIANLMMEGKSNKIIAQHLFLSEGTVKNYISELYNKMNIRSRSKVIDYFRGLTSSDEHS